MPERYIYYAVYPKPPVKPQKKKLNSELCFYIIVWFSTVAYACYRVYRVQEGKKMYVFFYFEIIFLVFL